MWDEPIRTVRRLSREITLRTNRLSIVRDCPKSGERRKAAARHAAIDAQLVDMFDTEDTIVCTPRRALAAVVSALALSGPPGVPYVSRQNPRRSAPACWAMGH